MTHELIHAYDFCRSEFDLGGAGGRACSEVRAAHLSGDCGVLNEFMRGNWGGLVPFKGGFQVGFFSVVFGGLAIMKG